MSVNPGGGVVAAAGGSGGRGGDGGGRRPPSDGNDNARCPLESDEVKQDGVATRRAER